MPTIHQLRHIQEFVISHGHHNVRIEDGVVRWEVDTIGPERIWFLTTCQATTMQEARDELGY